MSTTGHKVNRPSNDVDTWYVVYYISPEVLCSAYRFMMMICGIQHYLIIYRLLLLSVWVILDIVHDHAEIRRCMSIHLRWIWAPWVQWDSLFWVPGSYSDDLSQYTILVQFCQVKWLIRAEGWFDCSPRACNEEGWSSHLFLPLYPPPREPSGLSWTMQELQVEVWAGFTVLEAN